MAFLRYHASLEIVGGTIVTYYTVIESPIEPLLLTSDGRALTGLWMDVPLEKPWVREGWTRSDDAAPFDETSRQLALYFQGKLTQFDLPLAARGTPFQQRVWEELKNIPYGTTISYGELARRMGQPSASRAVGMANGRNPIGIIVPCHRVIGANGKLTGYGGGLPRKEALLALEASVTATEPQRYPCGAGERVLDLF
jgi:methylated-DNA-[protein]-cysteine S-methyltransferase